MIHEGAITDEYGKVYIRMYRLSDDGAIDEGGKRVIVLLGTDEMIKAAGEMGMEPAFTIGADGRKEIGTPHGWSLYIVHRVEVDAWIEWKKRLEADNK